MSSSFWQVFIYFFIEVGAIVCVPGGEPRCGQCPMESICQTRKQGLWKEIPVRGALKKRKVEDLTVCLIRKGDQVAIRKRPETGLLASLYELPNVPGHLEPEQVAQAFGPHGLKIPHTESSLHLAQTFWIGTELMAIPTCSQLTGAIP